MNESIAYDEYLDAGIPDALLEGLGFYANSTDVEMPSEADEGSAGDSQECETLIEPSTVATTSSAATGMTAGRLLIRTSFLLTLHWFSLYWW